MSRWMTTSPTKTIARGLKTRHRLAILPFGCSAPRARYILLLDDAFGEDAER